MSLPRAGISTDCGFWTSTPVPARSDSKHCPAVPSALFVESDSRAAAVIKSNIATLGLPGATVRRGAVATVLAADADRAVDLVFADPPYDVATAEIEAVLDSLARNGWVRAGSVVVVERAASSAELTWPSTWTAWPVRRYGDTRVELAAC